MFSNTKNAYITKPTLNPAVYTAASTTGSTVPIHAGEKADVIFVLGTWTDGAQTYTIQAAPMVSGAPGTWANVDVADLEAAAGVLETDGTLLVDDNSRVGQSLVVAYHGSGSFLRVNVADVGGTTGGASAVVVQVGQLRYVGANNPGASVIV